MLLFLKVLILYIGMVQLSSGINRLSGLYRKVWDGITNTKIIQLTTGIRGK